MHVAFERAGLVVDGQPSTSVSLASFMPRISTSAPSRRNFSTTVERRHAVRSQIWARLTSMTTRSTASRSRRHRRKASAEAKKTWPVTV
jgi:hypothetical protein